MTEGQQSCARGSANALLERCKWLLAAAVVIRVRIYLATTGGKSRRSSAIGPSSELV